MRAHIRRFLDNESAATMIEYGLIAAIMALAILIGIGMIGDSIVDGLMQISNFLQNANK